MLPAATPVMSLLYPASKTVLMQHLQTLVLRGNCWWVGGVVPVAKFERLVLKLAGRYPLTRDERGRTYDRAKGLASVHVVAYPVDGGIAWWVDDRVRNGKRFQANEPCHVACGSGLLPGG